MREEAAQDRGRDIPEPSRGRVSAGQLTRRRSWPAEAAGPGATPMITRRRILEALGAVVMTGVGGATYAFGVEPQRLSVTRYAIRRPPPWPAGFRLRIAALADIHACEPWMSVARIEGVVHRTNALQADVVVLLGDYVTGQRFVTRYVDAAEWAPALGKLKAPLGVFAVLGNHDWWEDRTAQRLGRGPTIARAALEDAGIRVLENEAVPIASGGQRVWLAGLADQIGLLPSWKRRGHPRMGLDDLPATLGPIPATEPAILLAHEPDIFPKMPASVSLTLSGHTHGGQVRLFGYSPVVPSRFRNRYAYGHVREHTDLIVSGGLGCSIMPLRFGVPPEIVLVDVASSATA